MEKALAANIDTRLALSSHGCVLTISHLVGSSIRQWKIDLTMWKCELTSKRRQRGRHSSLCRLGILGSSASQSQSAQTEEASIPPESSLQGPPPHKQELHKPNSPPTSKRSLQNLSHLVALSIVDVIKVHSSDESCIDQSLGDERLALERTTCTLAIC